MPDPEASPIPGLTTEVQLERKQAIAEGIALIAAGNSERWAAAQTGIPKTTLRRAYARIRSAKTDLEKEELDQELVGYAVLNASLAAQELGRRLSDPARLSVIDTKTLTTVYGVSTDKVALKRRWARPEDSGSAADFLNKLAQGLSHIRTVTVQLEDPADEAVNITPTTTSE